MARDEDDDTDDKRPNPPKLPKRPNRERDNDDDDLPPLRKQKSNLGLILGILAGSLLLCCGGGIAGFVYVTKKTGEKFQEIAKEIEQANTNMLAAQHETQTSTNLSQIGIGLQNFQAANATFPANTYGPKGRPLLSWRVHLLPFIDENALYQQFKLDEPWDSPNNSKLLNQMPRIFTTPDATRFAGNNRTYYRAFTGQGFAMEPRNNKLSPQAAKPMGQSLPAGFPDGPSITILVFEANDPVEWSKPDELDWRPNAAKPTVIPTTGGPVPASKHFWVVMADGMPKKVKRMATNETLFRLFNRMDANFIDPGWEQ